MSTFLENNKKKSLLALLLLFLRGRKTVTALFLVVALASFLFITPSSYVIRFPGGTRVAAAVAWVAGKLGVDTSQWGLEGGKRDFSDLLAAFRAAKESGGKAGWAAFMRANTKGGEAAAGQGSLGLVKGSRKDLETAGADGKNAKPGTVAGVIDPDEAKRRGENETVALGRGDLTGEREGLVRTAFAGGFMNGAAPGAELSGGAFAAAGFFGTGGGAAGGGGGAVSGSVGAQVNAGLSGLPGATTAKGVVAAGGTKGRLSDSKAADIKARTSKGLANARPIQGDKAYTQLAIGRGLNVTATPPLCSAANGCPGEFATNNSGAIYDGNNIVGKGTDLLSAPQVDGESSPNIPDSGVADGLISEAERTAECAEKVKKCEEDKIPANRSLARISTTLTGLYGQLGGACGDPCNCDPCNNLMNQIKTICGSQLPPVIAQIKQPCSLPSYCAGLGVAAPNYVAVAGAGEQMCTALPNTSCGNGGDFFSGILCMISSVPKCGPRPVSQLRCQEPSCG
jgi:hypothetical protein